MDRSPHACWHSLGIASAAALMVAGGAHAQEVIAEGSKPPALEVFGTAQLDYIQDFNRVDPNWEDTLRPSKIPTTEGAFGSDGQAILGVRQSNLGVKATVPIDGKDLFMRIDFDLFGSGSNEGETTFHLQRAFGQWGAWLAGKTDTTFMDLDIFPNTIDYWGPPGMVFLRNAQIRWTPVKDDSSEFAIAIESPSSDVDPGQIREIDPDLGDNLQGETKLPDLAAHYRLGGDWGHLQIAGLLRQISFETLGTPNNEPKDDEVGWGLNLTSSINVGSGGDRIALGLVYGEGIASYMNDGGTDLAGGGTLANPHPETIQLLGIVAYFDHYWSEKWSSSIGYSQTEVDNSSLQADDAFNLGQYASTNLLYKPNDRFLTGAELLWGRREDKDGSSGDDVRIQFSIRYNFSIDNLPH